MRLTDDERARLNALITVGKHPARKLLQARILLKADVSEAGDGWPDSRIAEALDSSPDTILRTRRRLVEEGLDAALTHKHSSASVRPRIFDGAGEAKLIALACGEPPKGRARWTLELLGEQVVELKIVERASDNTIGRTLKKTLSGPTCKSNGLFRRTPTRPSWRRWRACLKSTSARTTRRARWFAWTRRRSS